MLRGLFKQLKSELLKSSLRFTPSAPSQPSQILVQARNSYDRCDYDAAKSLCAESLAVNSANVEALLLAGLIAQAQNKLPEAEIYYLRGLGVHPDSAKLHNNLGNVLFTQEKFPEAEQHYRAAIEHDPNLAEPYCNLGIILHRRNDREAALDSLQKALRINPDHFLAVSTLAQILLDIGRLKEARSWLEKALSLNPDTPDQRVRLGMLLGELGQYAEALVNFKYALRLNPDLVDAHYGIGFTLRQLGRYNEALAQINAGLELNPNSTNLHHLSGMVLFDLGKLDEALVWLDRSIEAYSGNAEASTLKSLILLLQGDFRQGWVEYEHRHHTKPARRPLFKYPQWDGSLLTGKTLLIYAEQGLGDEIMFASCLPDVIAQAQHCVIECEPRLAPLIRRSFPDTTVHGGKQHDDIGWLSRMPPIDAQIAIGSLPKYYRNTWSDFPQHRGYLKPDAGKALRWRQRLDDLGNGLKVGIAWRGGLASTRSYLRSIDLQHWLPILKQPNIHFVSLQYTECHAEIQPLRDQYGVTVHHWQEAIDDYDETAALLSSLDLVISVCTAVVHLGGALGKTVLVLVPSSPEWRYYQQGDNMPWYPSVRLFRQPSPGDWETVIQRISQALRVYSCSNADVLTP